MNIVPHTHWDREWYSAFQTFRLRLVDLLDELLPRLEADPSYTHFLLDGQMAVVDDYLAVRPDQEERLRHLALSGRLAMGPWYILMDEFLVSGETIVRNLAMGLDRAASFGGAMAVGYLPDMFGHVAQMPQILRQFGLDHAVVWRGVPAVIGRTAFWWEAPDGSTVRAEYLPEGYGNGSVLPMEAKDLIERLDQFVARYRHLLDAPADAGTAPPVLWMNGTDHQVPMPWLGHVVAESNAAQDDYDLRVGSLADHLATAPTDGLGTWRGELRSGAHANLLMGVASNRTDVRQAAARAERGLEGLAEPLWALFGEPERWPQPLLDEAWKHMVHNSAHDSICACSVDEVCDAVLHRYAEATDIAHGLAKRAVGRFAMSVAHEGSVVVNPSPHPRGGMVAVVLPGVAEVPGTQVVRTWAPDAELFTVTLDRAMQLVPRAVDEFGANDFAIAATDTGGALVTLQIDDEALRIPVAFPTHDLEALVDDPEAPIEVRLRQTPKQQVLARVDDVAGYGWTSVSVPTAPARPVGRAGEHGLGNGLVAVTVDPVDGTFAVDGHAGLGRLVDGGDVGDTYNHCPPDTDREIERPDDVRCEVLDSGPVRGRLVVTATYRWPGSGATVQRSADLTTIAVRTTLELRAGEAFVRVTVEFDNTCRDHRVRALFPLPEPTATSHAECAFAIVERGLTAEGGPTEPGLPTYPSRRFVQAGGLTVAHEGLVEYELVDLDEQRATARSLAVTLLRCTGMLSQGPMRSRPLPAGPMTAMEGPQQQGPQQMRYVVAVGDRDPYALVDDAFLPLQVGRGRGVGARPATGRILDVRGAPVSSLRRHDGRLEVRVFNPGTEPTVVQIDGRSGWLVDLRGAPIESWDGSFPLPPGRLATATLDEP